MRRRDFLKVVAASATSWPLAARAQKGVNPITMPSALLATADEVIE
jgi:hypothetical protein